jgi:hypothetical protein
MTLAEVEQGVVVEDAELNGLAGRANAEHHAVEAAATTAVQRAIACGKLLLEAKGRIPDGTWTEWLDANFDGSKTTANVYVRFARHEQFLVGRGLSLKEAETRLLGMGRRPNYGEGAAAPIFPPALRDEGIAMLEAGASTREVARALGVSKSTVHWWTNPERARARLKAQAARRRAASAALREQRRRRQRDEAARRAGGSIAESYSLIRRLTQQLDTAISEAGDGEARQALNGALRRMHEAEDEVVRALGVE